MADKVISDAWQIRDDCSGDMYDHDVNISWAYEVATIPLVVHSDGESTEGAWIKMPEYYAERAREHGIDGQLMLLADPETLRAIAACLQKVADINELNHQKRAESSEKQTTKEVSDDETKQ
tara:strand:- start:654 stop:1016 length:363 start_codon:yes stop_codon:yes gene_type:complete